MNNKIIKQQEANIRTKSEYICFKKPRLSEVNKYQTQYKKTRLLSWINKYQT